MPTVNVILQLYIGGWREQTATAITDNLRIEAALGSGAIKSEAEARRVATGQFNMYATPITSRTVAVEPVDFGDTPWLSHVPGNTITLGADQELVESLAFRRDQDGHIDYAAELNSHVDTPEERRDLALKKMSNGTFGGTSRPAQPFNTTPPPGILTPLPPTCCTWGFNGGAGYAIDAGDFLTVAIGTDANGNLYPPSFATAGQLEGGLWHITGQIRVTAAGPASGDIAVFYAAPFESSGADPAASGGQIIGFGYLAGETQTVIPFDGVVLLDAEWTPELVLFNTTDQDITGTIRYNASGTSCSCRLATTPGGG